MSRNKDRISPANIIAIVGLAGLGVLTFFGALFQSEDGTLGGAIIYAVALAAGLALLLILCIRAKITEDNFTPWRITEWACLAAYIIVAMICYKPTLQFFHVVQHKETLQKMALGEIKTINDRCENFNLDAEDKLIAAARQMKSYHGSGQNDPEYDGGLDNYIKEHSITNFDDWKKDYWDDVVKFDDYKSLDSLKAKTQKWNLMELSSIAYELKNMDSLTWVSLDNHIKEFERNYQLVPVISGGGGNEPYVLEKNLATFEIGDRPTSSHFTEEFRKSVSGNNVGWVVYILLNLMVLLNYFLVRRSPIVQIRKDKRKDDGGMIL